MKSRNDILHLLTLKGYLSKIRDVFWRPYGSYPTNAFLPFNLGLKMRAKPSCVLNNKY